MREKTKTERESGVSEVVAFILIIGIIMTGISLVTLYGYPALLDAQQNANIRNMERNMISLQSDVNSLTYKNVPYKEVTMQVSGGVLSVELPDDTKKWFTVNDITSSVHLIPTDFSAENKFPPGNLKFLSDSGNVILSLQNGAVVKHQSDGSVMLSEPRWFTDEVGTTKTLVINLIQIDTEPPGTPMAKTGIGTVQMTIEPLIIDIPNNDNILEYGPFVPEHQITIKYRDIVFDYKTAWKNYFIYNLGMADTTDGGTISDIDKVIIKAWKVKVLNI